LLQFTLELEGVFVDDAAADVVGVSCVDPGEHVSRRRPDFIQLRSQIAITVAAEHTGFIASALRQPLPEVRWRCNRIEVAGRLGADGQKIGRGWGGERGSL